MSNDIPHEDREKLEEWKKKIKDEWEYRRKLVVFGDSEGNLITPTTTTSTTTTSTTLPPDITKNTTVSVSTSPLFVTNQTTASETPKTDTLVITADTAELLKIIGITCGVLASIIVIALICIRLCRLSARKQKERVSVRRPLNTEPEEHIYAEIEPLQGATAADSPSGASASGSSGVPLPRKKERRLRGVSSFRSISTRIYKWFKTEHTDDNQSVFYNRSDGHADIQNAPEPPRRNIVNGRTKRGKGTGVKRYESQSRRPLLDGDSQVSTASSNLDSRDNVYNPLLREEGRASGPYDHLRLSKTQSGHVKDADQVPPASPHDYFTLEKETTETDEEQPSTSRQMENIAEIDAEENKSNDVVVEIENALRDSDAEESETPKNHEYFILEPIHATVESPSGQSLKTNTSVKDASAKSKTDTDNETNVSVDKEKTSGTEKEVKTESGNVSSLSETSSIGKPKPMPKPRSVYSPTKTEKTLPLSSGYSSQSKTETEGASEESENRPSNAYTSLGDTLGEKGEKDISNGKDEEYVLTKLGDAPKPPVIEGKQGEDYLEPLQLKPDYVDVYPNPPPRTTSKQHPNASPIHSIETDV